MRMIAAEFDSVDVNEYDFLGCAFIEMSNEPFHLRHEYDDREKEVKQSVHLFGKRPDERGTQVFIEKYFHYQNNAKFDEDLKFYQAQEGNFRLLNKEKLVSTYLLNEAVGEKWRHSFMTKDGKYRRRIVYDLRGDRNAMLIVFSLDTVLFSSNQLFRFVKNNFKIVI